MFIYPDSIPLLSPKQFKENFPVSENEIRFVEESRDTVKKILTKKDPRFLIILGPCSIHDIESAKEYASNIKRLFDKVKNHFFLVMRVHAEKPRTIRGWKGLIYDPDLNGSNDIQKGLSLTRSLLLTLAKENVAASMEFLELLTSNYLSDLISWGTIGARTSSSQTHRQFASFLKMPIGFKNYVDGNSLIAVQGAFAASLPHSFLNINENGFICCQQSTGNSCTHIVLRGSDSGPNFFHENIIQAKKLLNDNHVRQEIIIDCAHGNSLNNYKDQLNVFSYTIKEYLQENSCVVGAILESHINGGNQKLTNNLKYAVSITDPCLSWSETEAAILDAYEKVQHSFTIKQ
jgi:3-deoxy-7-phosphoheptulonate synthase